MLENTDVIASEVLNMKFLFPEASLVQISEVRSKRGTLNMYDYIAAIVQISRKT
jgi:hypothetical protein